MKGLPHFHKRISGAGLCTILLFFTRAYNSAAQSVDCENILTTEIDSASGDEIIRSQKNIIISEDGKTGFSILGMLMDSTFILSITTVGGGACVNVGDKIHFDFTDNTKLELNNMREYNCEAKSSLYFEERFQNFSSLEMLRQKVLYRLTVWTKGKFVSRNVSEESASKLRTLLACFNSSLGDSTFLKLGNSKIYTRVEQPPQFMGGFEAMMNFIKKTMRYPPKARNSIEGTVYVSFIVNIDGSLTEIKTIKTAHPALDAEAERVIKLMPPWIPGRINQRAVPVRFILPIKFKYN